ncbi:hypothetical protein [Leptolyngbya sp. FACHB-261]|uniref:hypothetical protein n=1 Tax=Leptolyngbya sp. FACHB-261 TaxID=2692806 RepID=UPI0016879EBF|nr:hypothetical protein [Leptolyngbya sp. FACHB-261]MBD2100262.1 hypothetical protein [Leptolyngbya sp. FACHB-261]
MSAQDLIALLIGLGTVGGMVVGVTNFLSHKFSSLREELLINRTKVAEGVDEIKGKLERSILDLDTRLRLHINEFDNKVDTLEYRIHALDEKIEHRTKRFTDELAKERERLIEKINQLEGFLERTQQYRRRSANSSKED